MKTPKRFKILGCIVQQLSLLLLLNIQLEFTSAQTCNPTKPQKNKDHSCPLFTREAYTVEKQFPNGSIVYHKGCCDSRGIEFGRALAKGCQTTRCVLTTEPDYEFPCATMNKVIVDGQYVVFEEVMRDSCINEGNAGIAAVCCPPNSLASLLLSAYGAEPNEFPHQARLKSGNEVCGATVYSKDWVITAGHCVINENGEAKDANKTEVTLGTNIASLSSQRNVFPIKRIVIHEGFSLLKNSPEQSRILLGRRIYNDIALLELKKSIDFANEPNIRALPLAPPNFSPEKYAKQVVIVGWGTTDLGTLSQHLQKANLLIRPDEWCFKTLLGGLPYPDTKEFSNQLLCVGGIMHGQFSPIAGKGDSGGPAICRGVDGYAVHCGVTSFGGDGEACMKNLNEASCKPSVYVETSHFRDWIVKHAGEQDPKSLHKVYLYGEEVPEGNYEHQVRITSLKGPSCGGTLVEKDKVVTAGHCALTDQRKVRYGLKITTPVGEEFRVKEGGVIGSKNFARYVALDKLNLRKSGSKSFLSSPYVDDIAVIQLDREVDIEEEKLAKLPDSNGVPDTGTNAVELSAPLKSSKKKRRRGANGEQMNTESIKLMKRAFRILDSRDCQRRLDRYKVMGVEARFNTEKIFCGVEKYSGGGICDRELGGGLFCQIEQNEEDLTRAKNGGEDGNEEEETEEAVEEEEEVEIKRSEEFLCGIQTFRLCDMSLPSTFLNVGKYAPMIKKAFHNSSV